MTLAINFICHFSLLTKRFAESYPFSPREMSGPLTLWQRRLSIQGRLSHTHTYAHSLSLSLRLVRRPSEGHALTVVGFQERRRAHSLTPVLDFLQSLRHTNTSPRVAASPGRFPPHGARLRSDAASLRDITAGPRGATLCPGRYFHLDRPRYQTPNHLLQYKNDCN